jgi:hypothetical protein
MNSLIKKELMSSRIKKKQQYQGKYIQLKSIGTSPKLSTQVAIYQEAF